MFDMVQNTPMNTAVKYIGMKCVILRPNIYAFILFCNGSFLFLIFQAQFF